MCPDPTASTGSRTSRVIAPGSRRWVSQPSSCQRSRSAVAAAVSGAAHRQVRDSVAPRSVAAVMTSRVQARPASASRAWNRSASARAANAAVSTRSSGGSQSCSTTSSSGICRRDSPRSGRPSASRCARTPSAPNRVATLSGGSAANAPAVPMPSRISRSVSATRSGGQIAGSRDRSVMGRPAQNAADPPVGTMDARCAARTATSRSSATPTQHSTSSASIASTIRSAAAASDPK